MNSFLSQNLKQYDFFGRNDNPQEDWYIYTYTFIIQGYFSYVLFLTNHTCHFIFKIAITPKVKNDCL